MRELHIVSFAIPYPANYGGIIDVYFQIKALSEKGVSIILHCFQYNGKKRQPHLKDLCKEVYYYKRKTGVAGISAQLPYIVYSRRDKLLMNRLAQASGPILFEGIHSCYYLNHRQLKNKIKVVRCMNVEHEYYRFLAKQAQLPQKLFFKEEAKRLKSFEDVLNHAQVLVPISSQDGSYYLDQFPQVEQTVISAFHGNNLKPPSEQIGTYALFHGSLDVIENEKAALFLINKVFKNLNYPLIIAGKEPSDRLIQTIKGIPKITLVANPDDQKLEQLIANAQIHLMYATQSSGLKLKLLKALFHGKHVIANDLMLTDKNLEKAVIIANAISDWQNQIKLLSSKSFTTADWQIRKNILKDFIDESSVLKLLKTLNLGS
jgi:hypothetical protein